MRIVYDDTKLGLFTEFVSIWAHTRAKNVDLKEYSYGMQRISLRLVQRDLDGYLEEKKFTIGKDVHHAHGIGNNNRYPVYYHAENEMQQVGYLNIIIDPYGGGRVFVSDYNDDRVGALHKL